jgi:hypothetical protein
LPTTDDVDIVSRTSGEDEAQTIREAQTETEGKQEKEAATDSNDVFGDPLMNFIVRDAIYVTEHPGTDDVIIVCQPAVGQRTQYVITPAKSLTDSCVV